MSRDYRKSQRERDKKKRSVPARGKKTRRTVPSNRPSGTASGTKSSREMTYLEETNAKAARDRNRSAVLRGVGPNNQGVVRQKEHYEGSRGTVAHGPKRITPLKPKEAAPIPSPVKGRDIPLPKSKF